MSDTTPQRRRRKRSAPPASSRGGRGRSASPGLSLLLRGGLIALISVAGAAWIIGHFASDAVPAVDIGDPGWRMDGTATDLSRGQAALGATPPDVEAARAAARDALARSPLNIGALDLMAGAAKAAGDEAGEGDFHRLALARSWRDVDSLRWNLDEAYKAKDWQQLVLTADALLRIDNQKTRGRYAIGMLVALAADPQVRPYIVERVKMSSLWRRAYLTTLARLGPIDVYPEVMADLGYIDPTTYAGFWEPYLSRLMRLGDSRTAYAVWAGLLPPEQLEQLGYVFNGSFELPISSMPFDWSLTSARGIELMVVGDEAFEGKSSLRVNFGGAPTDFRNVQQTLILDPGTYRLGGAVKTDDLRTERGLFWRVYCLGGKRPSPIASSPAFSGTSPWTKFSVDFTVPETDCNTQALRLELPARISTERNIKGRIWLDGLTIQAESAESVTTAPPDG